MGEQQGRFSTQENFNRFKLKKEYTDDMLGTEDQPGQSIRPLFSETIKNFDRNFPQKEELRLMGGVIVSKRIAAEIRSKFDPAEVKIFSLERIKQAAKELGLAIFETQAEFPYSEVHIADDKFLIARYLEPIKTEDVNPDFYNKLPELLKKVFKGKKPKLKSKVQYLYLPKDPVVFPRIHLRFAPPQEAYFEVFQITRDVWMPVGADSKAISNLLLEKLGYTFSTMQLSEPVVFVPLGKLVPSKIEHEKLISFGNWVVGGGHWEQNRGAWYFESELGDFLKT